MSTNQLPTPLGPTAVAVDELACSTGDAVLALCSPGGFLSQGGHWIDHCGNSGFQPTHGE